MLYDIVSGIIIVFLLWRVLVLERVMSEVIAIAGRLNQADVMMLATLAALLSAVGVKIDPAIQRQVDEMQKRVVSSRD